MSNFELTPIRGGLDADQKEVSGADSSMDQSPEALEDILKAKEEYLELLTETNNAQEEINAELEAAIRAVESEGK